MKSAEEWATDYFNRFVAPDEIGLYVSHPDLIKHANAIQRDAIKACAALLKKCECSEAEAKICQGGRAGWCSPREYWQVLALLPKEPPDA